MKITKYEHANLVIEAAGEQLIIDPGVFSSSLVTPTNPVAVVITHVHADHINMDKVNGFLKEFPELKIFTIADVAVEIGDNSRITVIKGGESVRAGGFELEFFGEDHAVIHPDGPQYKNVGVFVNKQLYYPGDSFTLPQREVGILAVPTSGPWMKMSEAIDFMLAVKPKWAFPTHDALFSDIGTSITNDAMGRFANKQGITYQPLEIGVATDLD